MSLSSSRLLLLLRSASSSFLSLLWIVLVLLLVGTTVNASNSNDQNSSSRSSSRSSSPTATPSTITINKYIPTVDESSQLLSTSCASSSSSSFSSIGDSSTISSSSSAAAWGNILPPSHESTPYKEDPTNKSLKMKIFDDSKNNDFKKLMKRRRKFNNLWIDNDDDDDYAYADDPNTADIDGIRKWLKCNKNKSNDNSSNNNNNNILPTKEDYEILLRAYRYAMIQNGYNTHDSNHVGIGNEESSSLSVSAWFKVPVEINTKINNGGGVYAKEDIKRGTLIYGTPTKNQNDNHDSNRIVSIAEFPTRDTYREFFGFLTRGLEWDATANLACDAFLWSYPILQKQKKVSSSSLSSSYSICLPIGSDRVYLNHASTEEEGENIFQYIPEDDEDNEDNDEDIDIDGDSGGCPNNDELPVYALRDIKAGEELRIDYDEFIDEEGWEHMGLRWSKYSRSKRNNSSSSSSSSPQQQEQYYDEEGDDDDDDDNYDNDDDDDNDNDNDNSNNDSTNTNTIDTTNINTNVPSTETVRIPLFDDLVIPILYDHITYADDYEDVWGDME